MNLERRVAAWREAELISAEQAHAILAFEENRRGSAGTWIIVSLGALGGLAIATGLVSLIAANWDAIPPGVKLAANFALLAGALAGAWAALRSGRTLLADLLLFAHGGFVLAMIGLVSQVYHLSGDPWRALALAAVLTVPAAIVSERSLLGDVPLAYAVASLCVFLVDSVHAHAIAPGFGGGLVCAAAGGALLLGADGVRQLHPGAMRALRRWGATLLFGVTVAAGIAWTVQWANGTPKFARIVCAVVAAAWIARLAWRREGALALGAVALAALILGAPFVSDRSTAASSWALHAARPDARFLGFALFCTAGGAFAVASAQSGSRKLTNVFTTAVALRVVLLFVEVVESLALTGAGLLVTGIAFCGAALGFWKLRGALPVREVPDGG
jgi:hypothetical protein